LLFDSNLNKKYRLDINRERIENLVYIDTKYCVKVISDEYRLEYEPLLKEIRTFYDEHGEEETAFPTVKRILMKNDGKKHFLVTHRDRNSLTIKLNKEKLENRFIEIICKENNFKEKPSSDSFEYLINKYSLKREETIGIGDRDIDVEAGIRSNIKTVLISNRIIIDATYCINNVEKLEEIFEKLV